MMQCIKNVHDKGPMTKLFAKQLSRHLRLRAHFCQAATHRKFACNQNISKNLAKVIILFPNDVCSCFHTLIR